MTTAYTTGTITLTNGLKTVTGTGTGWATALIAGGTIYPDVAGGNALPIASVNSDTAITAAIAWRGATGTYSYALMRDTSYGEQVVGVAEQMVSYTDRLDNKPLAALASLAGDMGANKMPFASGATTMAWTALTSYVRGLLAKANATEFYGGLGVVPDAQMPERLRDVAKVVTDWNDAAQNGWFMADGAANAPSAGWLIGHTQAHNGLYCVQFVTGFTADVAANSYTWRRMKTGGTWAPWRRIYQTEGDIRSMAGDVVSVLGGDEADLGTDWQTRLSVDFTANHPRLTAFGSIGFASHYSGGLWVNASLELEDLATNTAVSSRGLDLYLDIATAGSVPTHITPFFAVTGLIIGRAYRLKLMAKKTLLVGPIYPQYMQIMATIE